MKVKVEGIHIQFVMQIDAHAGGVNDIAFAHPNKQLCVVTCGDDKLIKVRRETSKLFSRIFLASCCRTTKGERLKQVWDLTGRKLFNFEGHEAPVYSICPHQKENIQVQLQIVYKC